MTSRWPEYDEQQIDAVVRVLRSGKTNYWSGTQCRDFEAEFARYIGMPHAISLANGTVALELALISLGIGAGDEVIVPASSFVATASSVIACGAVPVFADISLPSQTVCGATLQACLSPRTRAVVAVHLYGCPCPMDEIMALAQQHKLAVIEDCAQAHGARYRGQPVGALGDVAAFSFCQDKIISTAGEGGMLLCRSDEVWATAWSYKDHGKQPSSIDSNPAAGYRWIHDSAGTNWRMTEVQAAIGRVQLRRLDAWVARRAQIAARLTADLVSLPVLQLPTVQSDVNRAWYRFPLLVRRDQLKANWNRDRIVSALIARGTPCGTGVCPELYREHSLERFAPRQRRVNASELAATGFCLTMHHMMTNKEIDDMTDSVRHVLLAASLS